MYSRRNVGEGDEGADWACRLISDSRLSEIPAILANLSKEMTLELKPTLAATLFAITAALSINAIAASDTPYDPTDKGHAIGAR